MFSPLTYYIQMVHAIWLDKLRILETSAYSSHPVEFLINRTYSNRISNTHTLPYSVEYIWNTIVILYRLLIPPRNAINTTEEKINKIMVCLVYSSVLCVCSVCVINVQSKINHTGFCFQLVRCTCAFALFVCVSTTISFWYPTIGSRQCDITLVQ